MNKQDIVKQIIDKNNWQPVVAASEAFAPSNIALCKYWGKRDRDLNLPNTSSLSISLASNGTTTLVSQSDQDRDVVILNDEPLDAEDPFSTKLTNYLNLFRPSSDFNFEVKTYNNIPTSAGLASSASGYAALIQALDCFFDWQLDEIKLSLLARFGSGSACRSLWPGFVEWHRGERDDGLDSHGEHLDSSWPALCVGMLFISLEPKQTSSRHAMNMTTDTSVLYESWPKQVEQDMLKLKQAIAQQDFELLGSTAENNALAMHATMLASRPAICYMKPATLEAMEAIWQLREDGIPVYFTQDAGPNLKLLFLSEHVAAVQQRFPSLAVVKPF